MAPSRRGDAVNRSNTKKISKKFDVKHLNGF